MGVPADIDDHLVARANDGDTIALGTLLDRHLHPAWRIALAASPDATAAQSAVVAGFCDALVGAARHPQSPTSLRTRIAAAVHRAAAADARSRRPVVPTADPVLLAFATLPTSSRTALWLTEVEGGDPDQIAPVLGLDRGATAALVARASTALRERVAANGAGAAGDPACVSTLGMLPAHAADRLSDGERDAVVEHLSGCSACAGWLAVVVTPRPALRRLVVPIPDGLPLAVAQRWAEVAGRDRTTWYRGISERAVGAAAAAVLAVGLAGAAFVGRDSDTGPELAAPAGGSTSAAGYDDLLDPVLPAAPAGATSVASSGFARGSGGAGADTARSDDKLPPKAPAPAPTPAAPPAAPPAAAPPSTPPATAEDPPVDVPSLPPTDTQATVEVPGVVVVGIGDETGVEVAGTPIVGDPPSAEEELKAEIDLPVLPPISLP